MAKKKSTRAIKSTRRPAKKKSTKVATKRKSARGNAKPKTQDWKAWAKANNWSDKRKGVDVQGGGSDLPEGTYEAQTKRARIVFPEGKAPSVVIDFVVLSEGPAEGLSCSKWCPLSENALGVTGQAFQALGLLEDDDLPEDLDRVCKDLTKNPMYGELTSKISESYDRPNYYLNGEWEYADE